MSRTLQDGEVGDYYRGERPPLGPPPLLYYVNGIQTGSDDHIRSAEAMSQITERVVRGVYNATAGKGKVGMVLDLLQCADDWVDGFSSKLAEIGAGHVNGLINKTLNDVRKLFRRAPMDPVNVPGWIRSKIPERVRVALLEAHLKSYNLATASLFHELSTHRDRDLWIIAHSQGNLIAADALWAMVTAYGETSLTYLDVYSLASPAPAWPLGIRGRHKVYGHTNDLVTLADPHNWTPITSRVAEGRFGRMQGHWQQYGPNDNIGLGGHGLDKNASLDFVNKIRGRLNLPPWSGPLPAF